MIQSSDSTVKLFMLPASELIQNAAKQVLAINQLSDSLPS